ncbi:hypothetical protein CANINC_003404 [Pichia inconspicua]|uniref:3',5'-cyclic-nucleotide phosphodiesterase n=1 Tax=Pichia inconspicua TaxID=52247 RepID=A0A4T0WYU1_9ASCO|nr:hypothetical protein CANINC_003404 [[Candida] inconspicua]
MPHNRKLFELVILGCSGGPISGKTCSFLLKPTDVKTIDLINGNKEAKDSFFALDAGTGLSSILSMLDTKGKEELNTIVSSFLLNLYPNCTDVTDSKETIYEFIDTRNMEIKSPFQDIEEIDVWKGNDTARSNKQLSNYQISDILLNSINGYLITHSHLDHVCSLVINSPSFKKKKSVFGIPFTIDSIQKNLFNDEIWPDLVSKELIDLHKIKPEVRYTNISTRYSITAFELSHGKKSDGTRYLSTAFLINDVKEDYNLLFFGDVESDLSSGTEMNSKVWNHVSPLINDDKLNSIIIECSTVDIPPPLFGHLIPTHLINECLNLRKKCIDLLNKSSKKLLPDDDFYRDYKEQPLEGLNMIIIHVKETLDNVNPRKLILKILKDLNIKYNLKIHFTIALSGISLLL